MPDHAANLRGIHRARTHRERAGEALRQLLFGNVLRAVPRKHMADFMAQYARELALGFKPCEQCHGDENLSTGQRKRIHHTRVGEGVKFERVA